MKPIGLYPVKDLPDDQLRRELGIFREEAELYLNSATPIDGVRRDVIQRYCMLSEEMLDRAQKA